MSEPKTLQFSPPQSSFNPSFWETLYERKLNIYKLANPSIEVSPQYEISSNGSPGSISFSANSFGESSSLKSLLTKLILTDSLEEFTAFDKRALLEKISAEGLAVMITGEAIERPELLQRFALLVFADLKSYKFFYWFCHAAITFPQIAPFHCRQFGPISERDSRVASSPFKSHMFLSKMYSYMTSTLDFSLIFAARYDSDSDTFATTTLSEAWQERYEENTCLVLLDLSPSPSSLGWAARNLLTLLSLYTTQDRESRSLPSELLDAGQKTVRIIVVRNAKWRNRLSQNYSSEEELATLVRADESIFVECEVGLTAPLRVSHSSGESRSFGWELNDRGKPGPRVADLSALLNTRLLMNQAVDLNLRLMKWRMWPALQVDALAKKRCLLLGAGTLGCAVARCLMGWGVRHITLVDNGIVSFSNPVRQSLFEYEDCVARRFKAVAAAERLVKIFPEINARAVVMTIPMPGHPFAPPSSSTKTSDGAIGGVLTDETAVRELDALIRDHDYIFALTDSREARWLPTVIARAYDKPVINSALGFDSYLVMQQRGNFGCYFCNDIIAAGNSRQGRPLDEQCTVTRPGLSFIAGGLCGEMFVALVHEESDDIRERNPAPHQIRGYLSDFSQMTLEGARFSMCTACSQLVLQRYRTEGDSFVRAVAEKPTILEEISGISQMTANIDVETFIDSDDDF